ncbi:MAG: hypothetical protein H7296_13090 [Bacteroidia bacterium]|nr:hypothetical protein [Bacteroidia bacterium]
MNKKTAFLITYFLLCFGMQAQTLVFINTEQNKIIKAKPGNQLSLHYCGYLGQTESYKQTISFVTDSSVILGLYLPKLSSAQNLSLAGLGLGYKEILLRDILVFRRMSIGRTLLKSTLGVGAALASIIMLNQLYEHSSLSTGAKIGISLGVGLGTTYLINVFISDRPKYAMKDGWRVETVK